MRWLFGGAGLAVGAYGVYLLLSLGLSNLLAALYWLAGGVILHDGLIGPALIVVGVGVAMLVPHRVRAPVAAGLIVLGTVTMTAIPMLGRFGAKPDNPTLLDRNYTVGWLVFAALVALGAGLGVVRVLSRASVDSTGVEPTDVVHEPEEG
ncbi:MAG: hypothetical protein ABI873_11625 [Marmoricola sp.]